MTLVTDPVLLAFAGGFALIAVAGLALAGALVPEDRYSMRIVSLAAFALAGLVAIAR